MIFLFIVLLIFGTGKLSTAGKHLGTAIREFKTNVRDPENKDDDSSAGTKTAE